MIINKYIEKKKINTWMSPLLLLFVHSTSTKVTRYTCITEPRVAPGGGGEEEVGMARKSLGMGEREKKLKLSTCSGRRERKDPRGFNVEEPQ